MFGIIHTLISLGAAGVSGLKAANKEHQSKIEARQEYINGNNPAKVYFDYKSRYRSLDNNKLVNFEKDRLTGDIWVREGAPSKRVKNISEEWRQQFYIFKKNNPEKGRTVINDINIPPRPYPGIVEYNDTVWKKEYYCAGQWFKDLKTGDLYVIRRADGIECYMNIKTRKLVRPSDDFLKENKIAKSYRKIYSDEEIDEIIREWNKKIDNNTWLTNEFVDKGTDLYMYYYYFNDDEGYSSRAFKELEMMGRAQPIRLR